MICSSCSLNMLRVTHELIRLCLRLWQYMLRSAVFVPHTGRLLLNMKPEFISQLAANPGVRFELERICAAGVMLQWQGRDSIPHIHKVVAKLPICRLGSAHNVVWKGKASVGEVEADGSWSWQVKRRFADTTFPIWVNSEKSAHEDPCCLSVVMNSRCGVLLEILKLTSATHSTVA